LQYVHSINTSRKDAHIPGFKVGSISWNGTLTVLGRTKQSCQRRWDRLRDIQNRTAAASLKKGAGGEGDKIDYNDGNSSDDSGNGSGSGGNGMISGSGGGGTTRAERQRKSRAENDAVVFTEEQVR
jgi:hypothetical protein